MFCDLVWFLDAPSTRFQVTYVGNNMKEAHRMGAWQKILRAAVSI
jgi:hypothetical protein